MQPGENIIKISVNDIFPSKYQPRKVFSEESIKELALSIKTYGILNPLLVRKTPQGYEIIAGERRYRAAKMLGLKEVPAIIKEINDKELAELALIENIQRNDLNPIEEAESYKEILTLNNITQEELSTKIGKSQSVISNKMRLLNLSEKVREALLNRKISERHGRTLLKLNNDEQNQVLEEIISKRLSVKETEELINKKTSKENIKEALNSIDIDNKISNTFNDTIKEIKEKGEDNMNNNIGIGSFFPQMNNSNLNMNNENENNTIMFNNTPMDTSIPSEDTIQFNNTNTVPLNTLSQEPTINTLSLQEEQVQTNPNTESDINIMTNNNNNNNNSFIETEPQPMISPIEQNIQTQMPGIGMMNDAPLFTSTPTPSVEEQYTIPVNEPQSAQTIPTPEPISPVVSEVSSVEKIKNMISSLNDEKLSYKEYSNDRENCIIITIEK